MTPQSPIRPQGDFVWNDAYDCARNKIRFAQAQSDLAAARLRGMKVRASLTPPQAATGTFPYPARTCAEWTRFQAMLERKA